jgi:hypothetical protein
MLGWSPGPGRILGAFSLCGTSVRNVLRCVGETCAMFRLNGIVFVYPRSES